MANKIIEPKRDEEIEKDEGMNFNIGDLLAPSKLVDKVKEISQKASEGMTNKRAILTKISNGFIVEYKEGMKTKVVFYDKFNKIIEDLRLFMKDKQYIY